MKEKRFFEIGIGQPRFTSTEIEQGKDEERIKGYHLKRIKGIYLRMQLGHKVVSLGSKGIGFKKKPYKKFKLLFGIEGQ